MRTEQEELKGAERGTAYHAVLERLDYEKTGSLEEVRGQIQELCRMGKISQAVQSSVWPKDIYDLAESSLGQRMKAAAAKGLLKRTALCHRSACFFSKQGVSIRRRNPGPGNYRRFL